MTVSQSVRQLHNQSASQSVSEWVSQSVSQWDCHTTSQQVHYSYFQSATQLHADSHFLWYSFIHSVSLSMSYLILSHLSGSLADCWGTTVDFKTSFLQPLRFSAFRSMIFHSRLVHSLILSSHRFLCLPFRLPPWTVPCRIVLASPDDRVTCPYHFSLCLFTEVRWSSYGRMTFPIPVCRYVPSTSQSESQSDHKSVSQSESQSDHKSVSQSESQSDYKSVRKSVRPQVSQSVRKSVRPQVSQKVSQTTSQSVSQKVSQTTSQSVSQPFT